MALSNIAGWNEDKQAGTACGTACGASEQPAEKPAACGTACGASSSKEDSRRRRQDGMRQYFSFQWHITDECDQRCKHCYIFSGEGCKELKSIHGRRCRRSWQTARISVRYIIAHHISTLQVAIRSCIRTSGN